MPQLDPTWFASQIFWLFVSFVLLYALISTLLLPPIMQMMQQRSGVIDADINASDSITQDAEHIKAEYEKNLAEARSASRALIDQAIEAHKAKAEQAMLELQAQMAEKMQQAEQSILQKRGEFMTQLESASSQMAEQIAGKLTKGGAS